LPSAYLELAIIYQVSIEKAGHELIGRVFLLFPRLWENINQRAETLSGILIKPLLVLYWIDHSVLP
jgi:ABC-type branched-subunit amino acid transport system ATPase component